MKLDIMIAQTQVILIIVTAAVLFGLASGTFVFYVVKLLS